LHGEADQSRIGENRRHSYELEDGLPGADILSCHWDGTLVELTTVSTSNMFLSVDSNFLQ